MLCMGTVSETNRWPVFVYISQWSEIMQYLGQRHTGFVKRASHYTKSSWLIVNYTLRNKLQWNSNKKTFQSWMNAFEYIFCEIAAILSRGDEFNLFHGPHTFACDCMYILLTQNINLARQGGAWNSLDTTEKTPLCGRLGTPDTHRPGPLQWLQLPGVK